MKAPPKKPPAKRKPATPKSKSSTAKRNDPPKDTRFKPGESGNRKGRPPGSKNLSTILMEAARAPVIATINGKPRKISKIQATVMQLATKAAAGDRAAIAKFLDLIDEIETRAAAARPAEFPFGEVDLEVLRAVYERITNTDPKQPAE